jgi:hypothetical protein
MVVVEGKVPIGRCVLGCHAVFGEDGLQTGAGGGQFCWNATYGGFNDSRGFGVMRFGK